MNRTVTEEQVAMWFTALFWFDVLAMWDDTDSKDFDSAAEEVQLWQQMQVLHQASL